MSDKTESTSVADAAAEAGFEEEDIRMMTRQLLFARVVNPPVWVVEYETEEDRAMLICVCKTKDIAIREAEKRMEKEEFNKEGPCLRTENNGNIQWQHHCYAMTYFYVSQKRVVNE